MKPEIRDAKGRKNHFQVVYHKTKIKVVNVPPVMFLNYGGFSPCRVCPQNFQILKCNLVTILVMSRTFRWYSLLSCTRWLLKVFFFFFEQCSPLVLFDSKSFIKRNLGIFLYFVFGHMLKGTG